MTNYTTPAFPPPAGQVSNFINPPTSKGPQIVESIVITLVIALLVVFARFWTRAIILKKIGLDDYLLIAAVVTAIIFQAANLYSVKLGLGRNIWDIPLELYPACLIWFFVTEMFYYVAIMFSKLSILAFYLRFTVQRRQNYVIYGLLAFIAIYNIMSIFILLFACKPVAQLWDPSITWGTCANTNWVYPFNSGLNVITDLIILILPMRMLYRLKLPLAQKLSLAVLFTAGGFVIVVTIVRLLTLSEINQQAENISMGFAEPSIWSVIEVNLCLICASVPALKPFVQTYFKSFSGWGSTFSRSRTGDCHSGALELSNDPYQSQSSTHGWGKHRGVTTSTVAGGSITDSRERSESQEKIVSHQQTREVSPGPGIMVNNRVEVVYEDGLFMV